jgi:hypothetical protein
VSFEKKPRPLIQTGTIRGVQKTVFVNRKRFEMPNNIQSFCLSVFISNEKSFKHEFFRRIRRDPIPNIQTEQKD